MKKKLPVLIPLVVVILAAFAGYRWLHKADGSTLRLSGNIELTQVNISFKTPGRLLERLVTEGDSVKKGQTVARLDPEQLLRQRDRLQAGMAAAGSRLTQLETAIQFQTANLAAQLEQRQAELRQSEAFLAALLAGSRVQDVEQARAQTSAAQTAAEKAASDWRRAQALIRNEDISRADFDRFKSAHESADAALKQARERLALLVEGPRQEDIEAARAQVARARAALKSTEAARLDLKRLQQETPTRRAEIDQVRADSGVLASQLSDTVAVTPIDGVVLVKAAEPGEVLSAGSSVLTIGDLDHPWLRAYVNEKDLGRIKLGTRAKVTTDSFPGKVYQGRITFISSDAEFTPKQIQTAEERVKLVYRIKIEIENPNRELKSNMPADAEILLESGN